MSQTSLLDELVEPPKAITGFLTGFAAMFAFGDKPTADQKRQAEVVARDCARQMAALKARGV